jgi:hypothetical protein
MLPLSHSLVSAERLGVREERQRPGSEMCCHYSTPWSLSKDSALEKRDRVGQREYPTKKDRFQMKDSIFIIRGSFVHLHRRASMNNVDSVPRKHQERAS